MKWSASSPGPDKQVSGSVCGQDPGWCTFSYLILWSYCQLCLSVVIVLSALSVCRDPTISSVCLSWSYCQLCPSVVILLSALSVCRDRTVSSFCLSRSYCQLCPSVAILLSALSVCRDPTVSSVRLLRSYCQLCLSVAIPLSALSICRDPTVSSVRLSWSYCQLCPSVAILLSALSVCRDPTVSSVRLSRSHCQLCLSIQRWSLVHFLAVLHGKLKSVSLCQFCCVVVSLHQWQWRVERCVLLFQVLYQPVISGSICMAQRHYTVAGIYCRLSTFTCSNRKAE